MLLPGQTSLGNIRAEVRQRADIVNSQYVTDAELNGYITRSYKELYDLLIQQYGDRYYFQTAYQFQTDGVNFQFALPTDLYKLMGVEVQLQGQKPATWQTLKPIPFIERNRNAWTNTQAAVGLWADIRYIVTGQQLWLTPLPQGGQTIQLWYAPRPVWLSDSGTITLSGVAIGNALALNGALLICVASGATGLQFNHGGTDTITATNLAASINSNAPGSPFAGLVATSSGAVVTLSMPAGAGSPLGPLSWSSTFSTFAFALPNSPAGTPSIWTSLIDGVSGWEEYITVDSTIKCKAKAEEDVGVVMAQKKELVRRIVEASENRDAGSAPRVSDSRRAGTWMDSFGCYGGGEGGY